MRASRPGPPAAVHGTDTESPTWALGPGPWSPVDRVLLTVAATGLDAGSSAAPTHEALVGAPALVAPVAVPTLPVVAVPTTPACRSAAALHTKDLRCSSPLAPAPSR